MKVTHPTWTAHCAACAHETVNHEVERSMAVGDGGINPNFPKQDAGLTDQVGFEVIVPYALWTDAQYQKHIAPPNSNLTLQRSGESMSSFANEKGTDSKLEGLVTQHPSKPYIEVNKVYRHFAKCDEQHSALDRCLRDNQGRLFFDDLKTQLNNDLPVAVRGNTTVPTMEEAKARALAAAKAQGYIRQGPDGGAPTTSRPLTMPPQAARDHTC